MTTRPVLYQLIEERLGEPLADFVTSRRPYWSWRQLAAEITTTTETSVSWESLRTWFAADESATSDGTGSPASAA